MKIAGIKVLLLVFVKVSDGAISLTIWFECDQSTESSVPYTHHERRRLLTGAKRKRNTPISPERPAFLAICRGSHIVKLVLPFLY